MDQARAWSRSDRGGGSQPPAQCQSRGEQASLGGEDVQVDCGVGNCAGGVHCTIKCCLHFNFVFITKSTTMVFNQ